MCFLVPVWLHPHLCLSWEHGAHISGSLCGYLLPSAIFFHDNTKKSSNLFVSVLVLFSYLQLYVTERSLVSDRFVEFLLSRVFSCHKLHFRGSRLAGHLFLPSYCHHSSLYESICGGCVTGTCHAVSNFSSQIKYCDC